MEKAYQSELSPLNRCARLGWGVCWALLFRPTPRILHAWRVFLLRCWRAEIGNSVKVYPSARIWAPWNLKMEDNSIMGDRVDCYSVAAVTIGRGVVISQDACLCTASHDFRSPDFDLITKPVVIQDRAWVAARAFIGPGVEVGAKAVVGACAVAFKDIESGVVVAGNPAVPISTNT